jgi:hypothetical protein
MVAEAQFVPVDEGSMGIVTTRDYLAPPGSRTASRMKGRLRNTGDPTRARGVRVAGGVPPLVRRPRGPDGKRAGDDQRGPRPALE